VLTFRPLPKLVSALIPALVLAWSPFSSAQEIRIGTWKTAQTIQPFFYAQFIPPAEKITIFPFTNPADQKTALLAGDLDLCGTTLVHAIQSAAKGQPVVLVASLCNKSSALVVRKDGPIDHITDLKGKRIGYVPGTMHEILLRDALVHAGISPDKDVTLMRVDFFDMGTALAAGNIDAFLSGEPFPSLAEAKGYGRILSHPYFDDSIGAINAGMLAQKSTIERNPTLVQLLVLTHARATHHLTAHPDQWLRKAAEFGTEVAVLEKARPNIELSWDMDEAYIKRVRRLGEKMQALGMIDREPDYDRLFELSFVNRAREALQKAGSETQ
jgi:NitT/TauT family transport system substrate-binding protein